MRQALALFALVGLVSCGGGGSAPTSPSQPSIPSVAGNYSGSATFAQPELKQSFACGASTVVTQSGATVSVAPIVLNGTCSGISLPVGQATIDATGNLVGSNTGTFTDASCGTYNYSGSGGFFGREFRVSIAATSATCYNFNFSAVLTR